MPQHHESSIPLDDDDILDLTEVAAPGKGSDGPPEPGDDDGIDFSADLDALLDSLAPDGTVSAPAKPSPERAAPEVPVAAPIKDQTPVTHRVDPNEEMAMLETSDIDSLLAELGADIPADVPEPPAASMREAKAAAPVSEFDGLLAQARAAEEQKAVEERAAKEMAAVVVSARKADPATAPAAPDPERAAVVSEIDADDAEGLDLNELDALLDDILATAPEMRAPASAVPKKAIVPESPAPAEEIAAPVAGPAAEPAASLENGLTEVIPVPEAALMPTDVPDPSLEARIRRLEDAVDVMEAEVNNQISENMVGALIDSKLAALFAPNSDTVSKIVEEVLLQLTTPEVHSITVVGFREKLEKMAAAAAAKVIREEIEALMHEEGPGPNA